ERSAAVALLHSFGLQCEIEGALLLRVHQPYSTIQRRGVSPCRFRAVFSLKSCIDLPEQGQLLIEFTGAGQRLKEIRSAKRIAHIQRLMVRPEKTGARSMALPLTADANIVGQREIGTPQLSRHERSQAGVGHARRALLVAR